MTMFIILGVLIFIVLVFLVFTSVKDRRKMKVEKAREEKIKEDSIASRIVVASYVDAIIEANEKLNKNFVPSIGEYKMGDIKNSAKVTLKGLKETKAYRLAETNEDNKDIITVINNLYKSSASTWEKNNQKDIQFIKDLIEKSDDVNAPKYRKDSEKEISKTYKWKVSK